MLTSSALAQEPIQVVLNGQPLTFTGTPPRQIKGSTLVPMRGIFEALGASVKFDKASQTVYGQKGATAIILPLGALTATVNGQPQTLPVPALLINGTTLVPLRFISQSLGAAVFWNSQSQTVTIQTVDPHLASLPTAPGHGPIIGQVTGVYTNTTPTQLTVRVGGENTTVPLSAGTIILRSVSGQPATEVLLSAVKIGDQVSIQRSDDGTATVVSAIFGEVKGTVASIGHLANGNAALTLDSGRVIELTAEAPITDGGRVIALSDIKPYETVVIRTNPSNSLGYGVAVVTGANANPTPPGLAPGLPSTLPTGAASVEVSSFTQDATKPLRAGNTLTVTLAGTPGGKATFAVPSVAEDIPMRETSPGVYVGTYLIPRGANAAHAAVLGKLIAGGVTSTLIQAPGTIDLDSKPPTLIDFGPAQNSTVESQRPLIYGTLSDGGGSGINPSATRLTLDGQDVTGSADINETLFTYKPSSPLANGLHTVSVLLDDKAGNPATARWQFQVSTGKMIQSFTTNEPSGQTLGVGSTVVLTLKAASGGRAQAALGGLARTIPMNETDPGVYVGEYTVKAGDNVQNAPVTAKFTAQDGTVVTTSLRDTLTLAAGPLPAPRIQMPRDGDTVDASAPLEVSGKAAPGSTVRVTISYDSKALGGILPVSGQCATADVKSDKNGEWTAEDLSLKIKTLFGGDRDTVFSITATVLDAGGNPASDAAMIQVHPG